MKRNALAILLVFFMATAVVLNAVVPSRHASAEVTTWTPINSAAELNQIRSDLAGHYKLMQDIDLAGFDAGDGKGWRPIGGNGNEFKGSFDGNGFVIRNLTIDRPNENNVGLFGSAYQATIANVHVTNAIVEGYSSVGGIAGILTDSSLSKAFFQGKVTGNETVGGLVGYNDFSQISDSYAGGQIALGAHPGDSFGGLVGYSSGNGARGTIVRSYSTAAVGSGTMAGGLVGQKVGSASVVSSYWNTETSGQAASAAGSGRTTAQLLTKSTYLDWDFGGNGTDDPIWGMVEGITYPIHYGDYEKVALASLVVTDANDVPLALDREFAGNQGIYGVRVGSDTDHVIVTGTPLASSSIVSVEGGGDSKTLALTPGKNEFEINVSDAADPSNLHADYKLTVFREDGSAQYPHRISNADQLSRIGDLSVGYEMDDSYELEADLNLAPWAAGAGWAPIGSGMTPFQGRFEGNNHTIANASIHRPASNDQGLFGVTSGATISNLSLIHADITGAEAVGGLIGRAENTDVSGVSVQGKVTGSGDTGGLIGSADASTSVTEAYAAAIVSADNGGGGLVGAGAAAGSVTQAFWDSERSGQSSSAGGGAPYTTADMMKQTTYTNVVGSTWAFGSGHRWGIIEGTTYPMPYASYLGVKPAAVAVSAAGTTLTMSPAAFDASKGLYALALAAPVPHAEVTVTPAAGQAVTINGVNGNTRQVDLTLGSNPIEIAVTGSDGQIGTYRLTLAVPSPSAAVTSVPVDGYYGIGAQLEFVVAYDYPVDVDLTESPELPIELDGSAQPSASYVGMAGSDPRTLKFRYTVQQSDQAAAGIRLADALVSGSPSSITLLDSPVSLNLASPLPDTSGIVIDGNVPEIELIPSTTTPVNGAVTVTVNADGTGTEISEVKWAAGNRSASYFNGAGSALSGATFIAADNGTYTVYAIDEAGNEQVRTIDVTNIVSEKPTVLLDYSPKTAVRSGVDVSVTTSVNNEDAGNAIERLRWAEGSLTETDFDDPTVGTDVPSSGAFHVAANGTYTVYALDTAGNRRVEEIAIANIVNEAPTITLDHTPKTATADGVDVKVSAAAADDAAGNRIVTLKWAEGSLVVTDFDDPTVGTDVPSSGSFHVTANGTYTVYAVDTAGNRRVEEIAIANIVNEAPTITLDYTPKTATADGVDIKVSAAAADDAAGNRIVTLKWAEGSLGVADFNDPGVGTDVPSSGSFHVTANGTYTVFAADTAGNKKVTSLVIDIVVDPPLPAAPPSDPILNQLSFYLIPGREYTLTIDGLELFIPADAILQATNVTLKKVTDEAEGLLKPGQPILSDIYELTKDTPGKFNAPVRLRIDVRNDSWGAGQHPALVYYDEAAAKWTDLGGSLSDGILTGNTDHFTKFALMPVADESPVPLLSDIDGHWAEQEITDAVAQGIISGYPDGTFGPDHPVTRAEFALLLNRVLKLPEGHTFSFEDQGEIPDWADDAVASVAEAGIMNGYPDRGFRPAARLSRIEAAVLIARAAGLPIDGSSRTLFADDAAIAGWAMPYIRAASTSGLVRGQSLNRFNPTAPLTRAEAISLLARLAAFHNARTAE
ncbi:S-layer homology domain-containing protein [Cohnella sp. JJ-181]|uniref:S-layer homology domain-containing protein n=1 Tax=Cohnella rhizoplanae TaxID=2974897 RepID=UPI0022FFA79A|nr:S-layer homology domain-containing protein [Cohnella sp. JJ-181]CAI6034664.1 hypothetical protein COHCIP112018_00844 [Cohnella sp. JJ-181]